MANQAALIGAGGAVLGALISAGVTIYVSSGVDRKSELERDIQAGLKGLSDVTAPAQRIAALNRIDQLIDFHEVVGWQRAAREYREKAEDALAQLTEVEEELASREAAAAGLEAVKSTVSDDDFARIIELEKAISEARTVILQEREDLRSEIEAEAIEAEAARLEEESTRAAAAKQLQRELAQERICLDRNCTRWIIP